MFLKIKKVIGINAKMYLLTQLTHIRRISVLENYQWFVLETIAWISVGELSC